MYRPFLIHHYSPANETVYKDIPGIYSVIGIIRQQVQASTWIHVLQRRDDTAGTDSYAEFILDGATGGQLQIMFTQPIILKNIRIAFVNASGAAQNIGVTLIMKKLDKMPG